MVMFIVRLMWLRVILQRKYWIFSKDNFIFNWECDEQICNCC